MARKKFTKYNNYVKWLVPFTEAVAHIVPTDRLDAVKGYKVLKNKEIAQQGQIIMDNSTRRFVITLLTEIYSKSSKDYLEDYIETILDTYAHELAHMVHWEHTVAHWRLKCTIQNEFASVLERMGIENTQISYDKLENYENYSS
jgi:WLM domain